MAVSGAPTGPRLQFRGTPPWDNRRASREIEGQGKTRYVKFYKGRPKEREATLYRSKTTGRANLNREKQNNWLEKQTPQRRADLLKRGWRTDKSDQENNRQYEQLSGCFIFPEFLQREQAPNTNREDWTEVRRRQNSGGYDNKRATALHNRHG